MNLGNAPGLRALKLGRTDADAPLVGPWKVVISFVDNSTKMIDATPDGNGKTTLTLTAKEATVARNVDIRNSVGNRGTLDVQ